MAMTTKTDAELLDLILKTKPSSSNDSDVKAQVLETPDPFSQDRNETEDSEKTPLSDLKENSTSSFEVTSDILNGLEQEPGCSENQEPRLDCSKTDHHNHVAAVASHDPQDPVYDVMCRKDEPTGTFDETTDQNIAYTGDGIVEDNLDIFTKQELIEKIQGYVKEISTLKKQVSNFQRQVTKKDSYNEVLRTMVILLLLCCKNIFLFSCFFEL